MMTIVFLVVLGVISVVAVIVLYRESKAEGDAFVTLMHKMLDHFERKWKRQDKWKI